MARTERLVVNIDETVKSDLERIAKERKITVSALCAQVLGKYVWNEMLEETWRYERFKSNSKK